MVGMGNLSGLFGQMKDMQGKMQRMQEELANETIEATSGGGMVTATVNGKGELVGLKIDRESVDPEDLEMLEDLVKAAVNGALSKSQQVMKEKMAQLTGGLNIPGLDQLGKMFG